MCVKVVMADDHVMVRKGIGQLLLSIEGLELAGEAGDGVECLKKVEDLQPQLLLLDITMPKKDGMEVLKELYGQGRKMKILMVTARKEKSILREALDLGVSGYLLKDSGPRDLREAVRTVLEEKRYVDSGVLGQGEEIEEKIQLTGREEEILIQLAQGMSNKEIASLFHITERTVKNHLFHIFRKLDISDRTQAAVYALKNGIYKFYK